jgi:hypothetical protein
MGWLSWFGSCQGQAILFFFTTSRSALELVQPPIQWVPEAVSLGGKASEREADHSSASSVEVKNDEAILPVTISPLKQSKNHMRHNI